MGLVMDIPDLRHISFVFFGSGPVAAESLRLLAQSFTIEAVVTKPKPAHHRGEFPVIATATELGLPIHTVSNRSELSELIATNPFKSTLGVLIDFGIIVSQDVIDYFPLGIVNSHFSILPEWRGADPITFAILSGQKMTGVSSMMLVAGMDEGPLIGYGEEPVSADDTTPTLTKRLIGLSYGLLLHDLSKLIEGNLVSAPQTITGTVESYSRKLNKDDGVIDWTKSAEEIEREIRAYAEWPKSRTTLAGKDIIITKAHVATEQSEGTKPGDIELGEASPLMIATGNGSLCIEMLKPAGKKEMTAAAFLAGYRHLLTQS